MCVVFAEDGCDTGDVVCFAELDKEPDSEMPNVDEPDEAGTVNETDNLDSVV